MAFKTYREPTVYNAVSLWNISEWFSSNQLLPKAVELLPQSSMSINVYAVAKILRVFESRGLLEARKKNGVKENRRIREEWPYGDSHFHA